MYEKMNSAFETSVGGFEKTAKLGNLAIRRYEHLGINDPLTHLYSYLERGEEAMVGIREDIETDIAERLPNMPFLNTVDFIYDDDDFVSIREKSSMRRMTENNLYTMQKIKSVDGIIKDNEIDRAKIEVDEISKINKWFKSAEIGEYYIFESLPINNQTIAVSRIYQKISDQNLSGNYISLHNPSINRFNSLRMEYSAKPWNNEMDILSDGYVINVSDKNILNNFIIQYVNKYDEILSSETGGQYHFGIVKNDGLDIENSISKIKKQKKITGIYLDTIRSISNSGGIVDNEIVNIVNKLNLKNKFILGHEFSINDVRGLLGDVIYGLTSVIDRADSELLDRIQSGYVSNDSEYSAVSIFSSQAQNDGENYDSQACPEYVSSNQDSTMESENYKIQKAYNLLPNDSFGKSSIGVCVVENCPSRGEIKWNPKPTLVGSCSVCIDCHRIFGSGQNPTRLYDKKLKQAV